MHLNTFSIVLCLSLLIVSNSLSFQDNIFRKSIENNKEDNLMISPYSLYKILSLLSNGATGNTQKEVLELLYPDREIDSSLLGKINSNMAQLKSNIKSEDIIDESNSNQCSGGDCKVTLKEANGIFLRNYINLKDEFKKVCDNYENSYFELIDVAQVNKFCSDKTEGKIDHIINNIDSLTQMLLVNTLFFKGTWKEKFDVADTKKEIFLNSDKTKVEVDTMFKNFENVMYYQDDKAQIISLPYISNKLDSKMIIIKPNLNKYSSPLDYLNQEKINLTEIESKLEDTYNVNLYLPKFSFKSQFDIRKVLIDLGMVSAFDNTKAKLDNIIPGTFVGQFLHKTFIDVNENGTEASGATIAEIRTNSTGFFDEEYHMHVNNSFIFMIQSDLINDIDDNYLMPFIGIVNNLNGINSNDDDNSSSNTHTNSSTNSSTKETSEDDEPIKFANSGTNFKYNLAIIITLMILLF
jgi:serpin B